MYNQLGSSVATRGDYLTRKKTMTHTRDLVRGSGKVEVGIRALEIIGNSKTNMFESESDLSG